MSTKDAGRSISSLAITYNAMAENDRWWQAEQYPNGNFHCITTNPFEIQILNEPTELVLDLFQAAPNYLLQTYASMRRNALNGFV